MDGRTHNRVVAIRGAHIPLLSEFEYGAILQLSLIAGLIRHFIQLPFQCGKTWRCYHGALALQLTSETYGVAPFAPTKGVP
ncbi:hypothetical protein [Mycobacterium sp. KBS0706]|uniref:hypothetical protein n=1 Tax=Mycobacterium sp. KBS0706 TaxID=2578109 RepID=UPI00163DBFC7|nr:hypothetical protein [Mycobacterium sp. KBS0706]